MRKEPVNQWKQLAFVMEEVFSGHERGATFLDDGDAAFLDMLKGLSAAEASCMICGENIVSHARHVAFSLGAYLGAVEQDRPSLIAEGWPLWDASPASPDEWKAIVGELESRAAALLACLQNRSGAFEGSYLSALGALAHMSFHLGAVQVKYDALKKESDAGKRK